MRTQLIQLEGPACICGAPVRRKGQRCRKCRCRARYVRRKAVL